MFIYREFAKLGLYFPRFLMGNKVRSKLKKMAGTIPPWERISYASKPAVEPWAYIRAHNEIGTIKQTLHSIEGILHKGVIASHGSDDGTDQFIEEFCKTHPGFKFFKYPHHVYPLGDPHYLNKISYKNTFTAFSNAALEEIPKDEWLIKIDADMIYFSDLLEATFHMVDSEKECIDYSRLEFIRTTDQSFLPYAYRRPGDHWLIFNRGIHFIQKDFYSGSHFVSYEVLAKGRKHLISPECSALHFPFEKKRRNSAKNLHTKPLDLFLFQIPDYEIDRKIFNATNLSQIIDQNFEADHEQ